MFLPELGMQIWNCSVHYECLEEEKEEKKEEEKRYEN